MKAEPAVTPQPVEELPPCPVGPYRCRHQQELDNLRRALETLSREVHRDALTGLFNYRHFTELLEQEVERARRSGLPLALVMVDLDHFKGVNDRFGHETGNEVLRWVAAILRDGVRRIDAVCRYGGEEMALILPGTSFPRAMRVAERLREDIAVPLPWAEGLTVTASFGLAVFPGPEAMDASALIRLADRALYRAKAEGRNRVCHAPLAPPTQVTADEKRALLG